MDNQSAYHQNLDKQLDKRFIFTMKSYTKEEKDFNIAINFAPQHSEAMGCLMNTVPVFNNDGEPSQHGFILQIDQPFYLANSTQFRTQYDKKLIEVQEKNKNLFVPKPRGTKIFCNVCKEQIEDYLQHTETKNHKQKFRKNKVINLISAMADEFQKIQSTPQSTLSLPSNLDSCGYISPILEDSVEHYDSTQQEPHTIKKVKLNDDVNACNKIGNSLVNSSNQSFQLRYGQQCL